MDWWFDLPWGWRCIVSLLIVGVSTLMWLSGGFRGGSWGIGIGLAMFFFSFPSSSERKGYHD
ncbi:MAG: hypothetical protein WEB58_04350 [Planctomycetaceae bacterium]